jgi:putative DNA primase/helicase
MDDSAENIIKLAAFQAQDLPAELLTEDSAGRAFTERYGAILRYDHTIGKWFVWTGQLWQCERTKLAFAWARELVRSLAEKAPTKVRYVANKTSFATGVEKFSQSDRACAVTADLWDQNPYLIGTPAGTIDLRTGNRKAADPSDYITAVTSIAPTDHHRLPALAPIPR